MPRLLALILALAACLGGHPRTAWTQSAPASRPASRPGSGSPNLVSNGDFEAGPPSAKLPAGWSTTHPDNVRWVLGDEAHGRVIEMSGKRRLMATYGVELTSERIAVKANTRYRCCGHTRSSGPKMKVFVKGYATVTRRVQGELKTFDDIVYQVRKDIEPSDDWQPFQLDFEITPAKVFSGFQHEVKYVRIRLWAYWPVGTCWFDEISFEELGPVPAASRRHDQPVTHVGLPPRLGAAGRTTTQPQPGAFDEEQTWAEAVNALRGGDADQAARLAERLIAHAPRKGAYRVLAARAMCELGRWDAAERHAGWLLEDAHPAGSQAKDARRIEPWQRDWACVVQARARYHTGRHAEARKILTTLLQSDVSPHARAAAEKLLAQLQDQHGPE